MLSEPIAAVERRYDDAGLVAAIVVTLGWHLASSLPTVLSGQYRPSSLGIASWSLGLALGIVLSILLLRGAGRGPALGVIATPILLITTLVVSLATSSGSSLDPQSWAFASAGWFALVAMWRRPLWELGVFLCINTAVAFAALVSSGQLDRVSLARFIMIAYGVSVLQLTILAGSRALTALARRMAAAEDARARMATRRLAAAAVHEARRNRFDAVQQTAADLLDGLARDQLDLHDPDTQQRIRVAVSRLRRLIVERDDVPDQLQHALRACADEAERRGIEVDLQAAIGSTSGLPVTAQQILTEPVIQVLAATRTRARITVVADHSEVTVAIVADAAPKAFSTDDWNAEYTYDDEGWLLWAQTRWSVPSPSR